MFSKIKWVVLGLMFAVIAVILYLTIDSQWAEKNNVGIPITIGFFLSAVATILCCFQAIDPKSPIAKE
jgi:hypothetical protein